MAETTKIASDRPIYAQELADTFKGQSIIIIDSKGKRTAYRTPEGRFRFRGSKNDAWLDRGEKAIGETQVALRNLRTQVEGNEQPAQKRPGFFRRLFTRDNSQDADVIYPVGRGRAAEVNEATLVTQCAKTARLNAKEFFGITIPQKSHAGEVLQTMKDKGYRTIQLDNKRNIGTMSQVAYIGVNALQNGKTINHVALAVKPVGGTEWYISDPHQTGRDMTRLSDYPATVSVAYELTPIVDNVSTLRLKNKIKVNKYGTENATTNSAKVEYTQIDSNTLPTALSDKNQSRVSGDDIKEAGWFRRADKGKDIISESQIKSILEQIAALPKTKLSDFVEKCVRLGNPSNNVTFSSRSDIIRAFYGTGRRNEPLYQDFLNGIRILGQGAINEIIAHDSLAPVAAVRPSEGSSISTIIEDKLFDDTTWDGGKIPRNSPLYPVLQGQRKIIAANLAAQLGVFMSNNGLSVGAGFDVHKNVKIALGIGPDGVPGIGLMISGGVRKGNVTLDGSIGAWNGIPGIQARIGVDNYQKVKKNLDDLSAKVRGAGLSGFATLVGGGVGFDVVTGDVKAAYQAQMEGMVEKLQSGNDPIINAQLESLQEVFLNPADAKAAILNLYRQKLAEAKKGVRISRAFVGAGILGGIPMLLAGINLQFAYKKVSVNERILANVWNSIDNGTLNIEQRNMRAQGLPASINDRIDRFGPNLPYVVKGYTGFANGKPGQKIIRINKANDGGLRVYAAPGYENAVNRYRDGTVDIVGDNTLTTVNVQDANGRVTRMLLVGSNKFQGARFINYQEPIRDIQPNQEVEKTLQGKHYHGQYYVPNITELKTFDMPVGVTTQFKPKPEQKPQPKPEEKGPGKVKGGSQTTTEDAPDQHPSQSQPETPPELHGPEPAPLETQIPQDGDTGFDATRTYTEPTNPPPPGTAPPPPPGQLPGAPAPGTPQ